MSPMKCFIVLFLFMIPMCWVEAAIVTNGTLVTSYNESNRVTEWVSYRLSAWHLAETGIRKSSIAYNQKISQDAQHEYVSIPSNCFLGFLCAPEDMNGQSKAGQEAVYTWPNVVIQTPGMYELWLESAGDLRRLAVRVSGWIEVVAGPVYSVEKNPEAHIPNGLFRIIVLHNVEGDIVDMSAYLISAANATSKKAEKRSMTVAEIEQMTGLSFFPDLSANIADIFKNQRYFRAVLSSD